MTPTTHPILTTLNRPSFAIILFLHRDSSIHFRFSLWLFITITQMNWIDNSHFTSSSWLSLLGLFSSVLPLNSQLEIGKNHVRIYHRGFLDWDLKMGWCGVSSRYVRNTVSRPHQLGFEHMIANTPTSDKFTHTRCGQQQHRLMEWRRPGVLFSLHS